MFPLPRASQILSTYLWPMFLWGCLLLSCLRREMWPRLERRQWDHRITEWLRLEVTLSDLKIFQFQPFCHGHDCHPSDQAAQSPTQRVLHHLQGWGIPRSFEQPIGWMEKTFPGLCQPTHTQLSQWKWPLHHLPPQVCLIHGRTRLVLWQSGCFLLEQLRVLLRRQQHCQYLIDKCTWHYPSYSALFY